MRLTPPYAFPCWKPLNDELEAERDLPKVRVQCDWEDRKSYFGMIG